MTVYKRDKDGINVCISWSVHVICPDENKSIQIEVPFGMTIDEYFKKIKSTCEYCGNHNLREINKKSIPVPVVDQS